MLGLLWSIDDWELCLPVCVCVCVCVRVCECVRVCVSCLLPGPRGVESGDRALVGVGCGEAAGGVACEDGERACEGDGDGDGETEREAPVAAADGDTEAAAGGERVREAAVGVVAGWVLAVGGAS